MAISDWTKTGYVTSWTRDTTVKHAGESSGKAIYQGGTGHTGTVYRPGAGTEVKILFWAKVTAGANTYANARIKYSNYGAMRFANLDDDSSFSMDWTRFRAIFYEHNGKLWGWLQKLVNGEWQDVGAQPKDFGAGTPEEGNVTFDWAGGYADNKYTTWLDDVEVYKKP